MRSRRTPVLWLLALAVCLGLSGCVRLPTDGPVEDVDVTVTEPEDSAPEYNPPGPQPGESQEQIVRHFLQAMTAVPIQTTTAREFLSSEAQESWNPDQQTLVYGESTQPRSSVDTVSITLSDAYRLDARGSFSGTVREAERTVLFKLVQQDQEWRISQLPDAWIVTQRSADDQMERAEVFYFDPTTQILVPETVTLPSGEQFVTTLVRSLLAGPGPGSRDVERTFLPPGAPSIVPVEDGVADIDLGGVPEDVRLATYQVAWTLRQVPSIREFRLSAGGTPLPGWSRPVTVDQGLQYDPADFGATSRLFALRDGVLVSGAVDDLEPVPGRMGREDFGVEGLAVSLDGSQVAGVAAGGTSVLLGSVEDPDADVQQVVSGASELLPPAWDSSDRLWLVDRTRSGAQVTVRAGRRTQLVDAPGVSGADVRRFLVSRDGSRFVAVVREDGRDRIVVSRVQRTERGRVLGLTPATPLAWQDETRTRVRDLAWRSPTVISVLYPVRDLAEVREVPLDGTPLGTEATSPTLPGDVRWLVGSPVPDEPLYAATRVGVLSLAGPDRTPVAEDLDPSTLTYAG